MPGGLIAGVRRNIPQADIQGRGWRECYRDTYANGATSLAQILAACQGEQLMIGCRATGQQNLLVGAEGLFAEVTRDVGDGQDAVNTHNGVDFYFSNGASWGFAPGGLGVSRNSCDIDGAQVDDRMCWHTSAGNINAG